MPYCRRCGAELPKDARFCPACGTAAVSPEMKPIETHQTLKVTGKPRVVVTNTAPGSVKVKSGPETEVTVDLDLRFPEDLDYNILQDGDALTITCRSRVSPLFSWPSCGHWVKGTLVAESSAGAVSIQDCEGTVKARTRAGSVNLENVNGTVSVRSSAGSILFTGALSKGENWFRTSVGSIEITLRGEPDLTVEASTRVGRVTCSPELTDARYERGLYTGRVGAGTGRLIAETKTGSIIIRQ